MRSSHVARSLSGGPHRLEGTDCRSPATVFTVPKLLTLDSDYSLHTIRSKHLEHELLCTDLMGFFEHVWTVHPLVGASPDEPAESSVGRPTTTVMTSRHTVVEGKVALSARLRRLAGLNFVLAQGALLIELHRLIRVQEISVIRVGDPYYLAVVGFVLARLHSIPLVIRVNGNYDLIYQNVGALAYPRLFRRRWVEKRIERALLSRAELVAGGNQNNLDYALANGARLERATLFRIGTLIDPAHFVDPAIRPSLREELGLGTRPFIVCVGRLEPVKYPQDVLQVLARCHAYEPRLAAVLVGDGSLRGELQTLARQLGLEQDVIFAGPRDQSWIAQVLSTATIIVAPDAGRSLVEGALSGTPIVAYDYEWHSELLSSGHTALLVPYRDVAAMSEAVRRLLGDRRWAAAIGQRARDAVLVAMDPDRLVNHERHEYERVLSQRRRRSGRGGATESAR